METELVIYPDQWHSIETPSYRKDRFDRYLAWYDRYLRPGAPSPAAARPSSRGRSSGSPNAPGARPLLEAPPRAGREQDGWTR